jgi:hypothetical protein
LFGLIYKYTVRKDIWIITLTFDYLIFEEIVYCKCPPPTKINENVWVLPQLPCATKSQPVQSAYGVKPVQKKTARQSGKST